MARNGTGVYSLPNPAFVPGATISSSAVNGDLSDIATALTGSVAADGQTTITGQLKFPNGTNAAPAVTFASDLSTGMFYQSSLILGLAAGGSTILFLDRNQVGSGKSGNQIYYGSGAILNPVGIISDYAGPTAPVGWLLCFGQVVNTSSYPELFVALGSTNTYGGNGTTTFGIPDCRGRASFGKDNMGGSTASRITVAGGNFDGTVLGGVGGAQNKVVLQANLPNVSFTVSGITLNDPGHFHTISISAGGPGGGGASFVAGGTSTTSTNTTGITISSQGTAASGGSGTALATLNPAIIFNKIIFAGRP